MERRNAYQKGRAGHARNINSYEMYREKYKKWRLPAAGLIGLLLVFGAAPVVGEEFQASLLTIQQAADLADADPAYAKKILLDEVKSFASECDRFKLSQCSADGVELISSMVDPNFKTDVRSLVSAVTRFEEKYQSNLAVKACEFDFGNAVLQAKSARNVMEEVMNKYEQALNAPEFSADYAEFSKTLEGMDAFVESCIRQ